MAPVFSKHDFNYSMKNIPIPSKKEYLLQLIHSVEKFIRNLRWRALYFLNPTEKPEKETFGFKSSMVQLKFQYNNIPVSKFFLQISDLVCVRWNQSAESALILL